ncbi:hypothetical protein PRIPAC_77601 [Pristionchus pacificus]|uniref:G protein-coupled receptor n=1 Tax=Pristionchus pacificus TaxID=54126 RepID=A0A2A6C3W8_PRIPA|nr:hypothetical protein PRIPAC_77601 [Pristionchus pacificus]|eukprot:PDM72819.1 G protein-coupled receptor [Pristionchus pacificus]
MDERKQEAMGRAKIMLLMQSGIIVLFHMTTCYAYVILQFVLSLKFSLYATHVGWMLVHGLPPFVYLLFNRSIRQGVAQTIAPISSHTLPSQLNQTAINR